MKAGGARRLTDKERETIQLLRYVLNTSQAARAIKCDRRTVRYWQAMRSDKHGRSVFVRPKGLGHDAR